MMPATFILYCSWHVERTGKNNLNRIPSKEKQIVVYNQLRTALHETDQQALAEMHGNFLASLLKEPGTCAFYDYFMKNYTSNVTNWSYCHRRNSGLNTNMLIEWIHRTIKYIYLKGKHNKRPDVALQDITKFSRNKLLGQIIAESKRKANSNINQQTTLEFIYNNENIGSCSCSTVESSQESILGSCENRGNKKGRSEDSYYPIAKIKVEKTSQLKDLTESLQSVKPKIQDLGRRLKEYKDKTGQYPQPMTVISTTPLRRDTQNVNFHSQGTSDLNYDENSDVTTKVDVTKNAEHDSFEKLEAVLEERWDESTYRITDMVEESPLATAEAIPKVVLVEPDDVQRSISRPT
ncbi:hypothetical protein GWI33_005160 [Rhynchophorus ferrugineus]|uniref:Uncharacterized protein n=1 Tax=Rhynchophorus ferrugineus TaxID=354439 RepID=A0A834IH88_RHYFE|nr:hypothetical protein GWI33_005160 [Rhynchophorus ferrugineus]